MTRIRKYNRDDAHAVGILVADTYSEYNLDFAAVEELEKLLGPFWFARSEEPGHQDAIAAVIEAEMVFVAEERGEVVGVLRGRMERLQSLFVCGDHQRRGSDDSWWNVLRMSAASRDPGRSRLPQRCTQYHFIPGWVIKKQLVSARAGVLEVQVCFTNR